MNLIREIGELRRRIVRLETAIGMTPPEAEPTPVLKVGDSPPAEMANRVWDKAEEDSLVSMCRNKVPDNWIARELRRTISGVQNRRYVMKKEGRWPL